MRPLQGVIVKVGGGIIRKGYMKIELESGNTITVKRIAGLVRGSEVEISYDFTHNRVRDIWLAGQRPDVSKLVKPDDIEEQLENVPSIDGVVSEREFSCPQSEEDEWREEEERKELEIPSFPPFDE